jgi:prepilin-type N-terminal cleavage/methylation domain-containing protein
MANRRNYPSEHRVPGRARGFTLIELMVVIVIIGILTAVVVTVASRVTKGGKFRLTEDTIRVLDQMYTEYVQTKEAKPADRYVDATGREFPIIDGRIPVAGPAGEPIGNAEPTLALFLLDAVSVPGVDSTLKSLDSRLVEEVNITTGVGTPQIRNSLGVLAPARGLTVKDGFGNPIRFVHPAFDGGHGAFFNGTALITTRVGLSVQYRGPSGQTLAIYSRSYRPWNPSTPGIPDTTVGDADEGICQSGRAYFYSAGLDGDPGTREDNVYTTRPQFPADTAKFN